MKTILSIAIFLFATFLVAQEKKDYLQYQTILLTPDFKNLKKFTNNMAKHNKKYHAKGPYQARVYRVETGTDVGKVYWVMGPSTFTHLDNRPKNVAHNKDWSEKVMPYISNVEHGEYWRFMDDMRIDNYKDWENNPLTIWLIRYITVAPTEDGKIDELHAKIKATIAKSGKAKFWGIMDNQFIQGKLNGRHLMGITGMKTWSEMDDDWEFKKHFEEIYGKDSFKDFVKTYNQVFSNSWNEIHVLDKKMSGME